MVKRSSKVSSKEITSVSMNSYLLNRAKELVESNDFSSVSDVISTALAEFLVRYDDRRKTHENQSDNPKKVITRPVVIE